jgi:hypothetical protein
MFALAKQSPFIPTIVSLRSLPISCFLRRFPVSYYEPRIFHVSCVARTALSAQANTRPQAASAAVSESVSVVDHCVHGQENCGLGYREGKSDAPVETRFSQFNAVEADMHLFSSRGSRLA